MDNCDEIQRCLECIHDQDCSIKSVLDTLDHSVLTCNDYERKR